jgi:hypothetical protein
MRCSIALCSMAATLRRSRWDRIPPRGELLIPPLGSRIIRKEDSGRRPRSFARRVVGCRRVGGIGGRPIRGLDKVARCRLHPASRDWVLAFRPATSGGRVVHRPFAAPPSDNARLAEALRAARRPALGVHAHRERAQLSQLLGACRGRMSGPVTVRGLIGPAGGSGATPACHVLLCRGQRPARAALALGGWPPWRPARPSGRRPAGTASTRACCLTSLTSSSAAGRGCWSCHVGSFLVGLEVCVAPMRRRGLGVATGRLPGGNDRCYRPVTGSRHRQYSRRRVSRAFPKPLTPTKHRLGHHGGMRALGHWGIQAVRHLRDVTVAEDNSQVGTGNAPGPWPACATPGHRHPTRPRRPQHRRRARKPAEAGSWFAPRPGPCT